MWIEQICGKDIAEMQFKSYEKGFNGFQDIEPILLSVKNIKPNLS